MDWYIAEGDRQKGPFRLEDLPAQGLRRDSLVWRPGMTEWDRAEKIDEIALAGLLAAPGNPYSAPPQYPAPVQPAQAITYATPLHAAPPPPFNPAGSNRVAAGLCGILLGGLGVHKFILGMTTSGVIMLLVSLVGGMFTCGMASMVMSLIGLIEGIIYLTRSEEDFYLQYVVRKKEWF
jgi:TM2 domain-containing membrane protein YozV